MKKQILLLTLLVFSVLFAFSQAPRRVMVEGATNASCGPCASQNPAFDALLEQNIDKVAVVKYHGWWPGNDPMYDENVEDHSARINYYGINSVPRVELDGQYDGQPGGVTQAMIDSYAAVDSPFEDIDIYHYLSDDEDSIFVFMRIQAAQDFSQTFMKGMCAVVEKHIHYNSAPGSNGETDFYDVMKKLLPNSSGSQIQSNWVDGEYKIIAQAWELENVYDVNQLSAIGFVQNSNSKFVYQSGVGSDQPFDPLFNVDAAPAGISNITTTTCLPRLTPAVSFANYGADNIVSTDIHYSINGGTEQVVNWTGNIEYLKLHTVLLPEIEFDLMDDNELLLYFSNTNGTGDEYPANDTVRFAFGSSISVVDNISLIVKLDDAPEETTWEITNAAGEIVFEGGPYSTPNGFISQTLEFDQTDCLLFTIHDAGENGISLPGFFSLFKGSTQILTGSDFGSVASQMFSAQLSVGTSEIELQFDTDLKVYPNPMTDAGVVSFVLFNDAQVEINLLNRVGQLVHQYSNDVITAGTQSIAFETSDLQAGIYFMEVIIDGKKDIRKITVIQ